MDRGIKIGKVLGVFLVISLILVLSNTTLRNPVIHNPQSLSVVDESQVNLMQVLRSTIESIAQVGGLTIKMSNTYSEIDSGSPSSYPWEYIAEPLEVTTFELEDANVLPDSSDSLDYRWILDDHLQGVGKSVKAIFAETGSYDLTVEAFWPGLEIEVPVLFSKTITITVKYVRREIRQLTDQDREAFFNAVSILQRVPTKVGQRIYGSKYFSKDYFVRMHLYYGGNGDCDHWHQGPGFVTSHMAYTLMFEQALQSVNPKISIPYWDFTLESTFYEPDTWRNSPVFSSDWFGEASPDNELHTVSAGRFAYVPTMFNAREFSEITNSFGMLRAPWNSDSTPFMTRSKSVYGLDNNMKPSGCSEYAKVLRSDNWIDLAKQLNSAAHGHIHETVGGSWNHPLGEQIGTPTDAVFSFAHQIQALSKVLWRSGYLYCVENCDPSLPTSSCACTCPTLENEQGFQTENPYDILRTSGVLESAVYFDESKNIIKSFVSNVDNQVHYTLDGYSEKQSEEIYTNMLKTLCNPGHIGDMFQATSSNDITFWVLHPTMDRLWHHKRLLESSSDSSFDDSWDKDCNECYGHNPDDLQPFKNLFNDDHKNYYTNAELYDLLHPTNENLPYVYADFNWDHCTMLGYKME
jgi:hypothetical protein